MIGCDLHPLYLSTRYARERAAALGARLVEVQHHHAHAASAMAEHGLDGPVLALCWDGTGLGSDGTAWGGELLRCWPERFERLATFRPLPLPGGDRAIREPWRVALAALLDAFDDEAPLDLPLFAGLPAGRARGGAAHAGRPGQLAAGPRRRAGLRRRRGAGAGAARWPATRGSWRWPSTAPPTRRRPGATPSSWTAPGRSPSSTCGRSGERWWPTCGPAPAPGPSPPGSTPRWRPGARRWSARPRRGTGALPVVLTGGCFQNAFLAERIATELSGSFKVYLHGQVPPGDGGLALGQALVADAVARG